MTTYTHVHVGDLSSSIPLTAISATSAPLNSIFLDTADGRLKFKNAAGAILTLAPDTSQVTRYGIVANAKGDAPNAKMPLMGPIGVTMAREEWKFGVAQATTEKYAGGSGDIFSDAATQGIQILPLLNVTETSWNAGNAAIRTFLTNWVTAYGIGGTYWVGKTYAAYAPTWVELCNEPYGTNEGWTATTFANFVADVVPLMRAANPNINIIIPIDVGEISVAGPVPTANSATDYIHSCWVAQPNFHTFADAWAVHPYAHDPTPGDPLVRFNFRRIETIKARIEAHTSARYPYWITEVGNAADNRASGLGTNDIWSETEQATWLGEYMDFVQTSYVNWPIYGMFVYHLHDLQAYGATTQKEDYFGILRSDRTTKKAAYTTYQSRIP